MISTTHKDCSSVSYLFRNGFYLILALFCDSLILRFLRSVFLPFSFPVISVYKWSDTNSKTLLILTSVTRLQQFPPGWSYIRQIWNRNRTHARGKAIFLHLKWNVLYVYKCVRMFGSWSSGANKNMYSCDNNLINISNIVTGFQNVYNAGNTCYIQTIVSWLLIQPHLTKSFFKHRGTYSGE